MSKLISKAADAIPQSIGKGSSSSRGTKIRLSNGRVISNENAHNGSVSSLSSGRGTIKETGSVLSHRGSVLSVSKSELSNKPLTKAKQPGVPRSVVSNVSSNVERRRRRQQNQRSDVTMKSNQRYSSLTRFSMESGTEMNLYRSQSEGVLNDCSESLHELKYEEITAFLQALKTFKRLKQEEKLWKSRIKNRLNEIRQRRPPIQNPKDNHCYICHSTMLPIIRSRHNCPKCLFDVCPNCISITNNSQICKNCVQEVKYESKLCGMFANDRINMDHDINQLESVAQGALQTSPQSRNSKVDEADMPMLPNGTNPDARSSPYDTVSLVDTLNTTNSSTIRSSLLESNKKGSSQYSVIMSQKSPNECGEILLGLSYDFAKSTLKVMVKSCRNIKPAMKNNLSNPFVKLTLLPDPLGENKKRTKTISGTLNPDFSEYIRYRAIPYDELMARTLQISVWHSEWLSKDVFLGELLMKLGTYSFENASPLFYKLDSKKPISIHPSLTKYCGDLNVAIKFSIVEKGNELISMDDDDDESSAIGANEKVKINLSQKGQNQPHRMSTNPTQSLASQIFNKVGVITIWIRDASNLLTSKYDKLPSAYAKCVILPETIFDMKKKTPVIRKNFNPIWNTSMTFTDIPLDKSDVKIELSVWHKRPRFLPDYLLGVVLLDFGEALRQLLKSNELRVYQDQETYTTESEICSRMIRSNGRWLEAQLQLKPQIFGHETTRN